MGGGVGGGRDVEFVLKLVVVFVVVVFVLEIVMRMDSDPDAASRLRIGGLERVLVVVIAVVVVAVVAVVAVVDVVVEDFSSRRSGSGMGLRKSSL